MKFLRLLVVPVALIALSACSGSDSPDGYGAGTGPDSTPSGTPEPSAEPSAELTPTGPECSDVWVDGATLPADYEGCLIDGQLGTQDAYPCLDDTTLVVFDDTFYAVTGGPIREPNAAPLQDTEKYGATYADCTGE